MDAIFADEQFWQSVGYVIGMVIVAVITAFALRYASKEMRQAWRYLRGNLDWAITKVDEPGDPLIILLDRYIPGQTDKALSAMLPAILRAAADALDKVLAEPPQEVAVGDTAK